MEICISIQSTEPLAGEARAENKGPLPFEGWLELLRVLSSLVGAGGHPSGPESGASHGPPTPERGIHGRADKSDS